MPNWFLCTIKYQKEEENGKLQKVSESYLVDAMSFSEAEARMYEELGSIIRGEFQVSNISKSNFTDIFFFDDSDVWYKCKVSYVDIDEKSKKEKKVNQYMLVTAANVKQAYERIQESLSTMLVPFEIPSIAVSSLVEIFQYVPQDQRIPKNLKPLSEVTEAS